MPVPKPNQIISQIFSLLKLIQLQNRGHTRIKAFEDHLPLLAASSLKYRLQLCLQTLPLRLIVVVIFEVVLALLRQITALPKSQQELVIEFFLNTANSKK